MYAARHVALTNRSFVAPGVTGWKCPAVRPRHASLPTKIVPGAKITVNGFGAFSGDICFTPLPAIGMVPTRSFTYLKSLLPPAGPGSTYFAMLFQSTDPP